MVNAVPVVIVFKIVLLLSCDAALHILRPICTKQLNENKMSAVINPTQAPGQVNRFLFNYWEQLLPVLQLILFKKVRNHYD